MCSPRSPQTRGRCPQLNPERRERNCSLFAGISIHPSTGMGKTSPERLDEPWGGGGCELAVEANDLGLERLVPGREEHELADGQRARQVGSQDCIDAINLVAGTRRARLTSRHSQGATDKPRPPP